MRSPAHPQQRVRRVVRWLSADHCFGRFGSRQWINDDFDVYYLLGIQLVDDDDQTKICYKAMMSMPADYSAHII